MKLVSVKDSSEGTDLAHSFLIKNSDLNTVLFLSGGKTPKPLYDLLLSEGRLQYGAVGMIDERYGEVGHEKSNANIMKGFNPFYPILKGESLENTALQYDRTVRSLFAKFSKSIGLFGIGTDGHIASLPAGNKKLKIKSQKLVTYFEDFPGENPKRVTMTFEALSKLDQILIIVFGKDKKEALRKMFARGPSSASSGQAEWEIPARFFLRPEISQKTILITDQKV